MTFSAVTALLMLSEKIETGARQAGTTPKVDSGLKSFQADDACQALNGRGPKPAEDRGPPSADSDGSRRRLRHGPQRIRRDEIAAQTRIFRNAYGERMLSCCELVDILGLADDDGACRAEPRHRVGVASPHRENAGRRWS